jgi:hypothetical protein
MDNEIEEIEQFSIVLPLPPPKGHTHLRGQYATYPTKAYKDWLTLARERVERVDGVDCRVWPLPDCGQMPAPMSGYVDVFIEVTLGPRQKDAHNYVAPILDLLGGARISDNGRVVHDAPIVYRDDSQVASLHVVLQGTRHPDPFARVGVNRHAALVVDWKKRK